MKPKRRQAFPCGTQAGLERHLRASERPCGECLPGSATYSAAELAELTRVFHERERDRLLWITYRISHATFVQLLAAQENCCACCRATVPGKSGWHVDHDPVTRHIRGILCTDCNTGIQLLGDDLVGVQRAITYLLEHVERGGHPHDERPPQTASLRPEPSQVMQECFALFARGVVPSKAVVLKKLDPSLVTQIFAAWQDRPVELPILRDDHRYQVVDEVPPRYCCACGFTAHFHDIDSMIVANDRMKEHALNAGTAALVRLESAGAQHGALK